jgi:hypothetical protein
VLPLENLVDHIMDYVPRGIVSMVIVHLLDYESVNHVLTMDIVPPVLVDDTCTIPHVKAMINIVVP